MSVLFQGNQHCGIPGKSKFLCCSREISISLVFYRNQNSVVSGETVYFCHCFSFFFKTNNTVVFSVKHHSSCDFCTNVYLGVGNKLLNLLRSE